MCSTIIFVTSRKPQNQTYFRIQQKKNILPWSLPFLHFSTSTRYFWQNQPEEIQLIFGEHFIYLPAVLHYSQDNFTLHYCGQHYTGENHDHWQLGCILEKPKWLSIKYKPNLSLIIQVSHKPLKSINNKIIQAWYLTEGHNLRYPW